MMQQGWLEIALRLGHVGDVNEEDSNTLHFCIKCSVTFYGPLLAMCCIMWFNMSLHKDIALL